LRSNSRGSNRLPPHNMITTFAMTWPEFWHNPSCRGESRTVSHPRITRCHRKMGFFSSSERFSNKFACLTTLGHKSDGDREPQPLDQAASCGASQIYPDLHYATQDGLLNRPLWPVVWHPKQEGALQCTGLFVLRL
jgi:hypothetical protein